MNAQTNSEVQKSIGPADSSFHVVDIIIFVAVLLASTGIGLYHAFTGGKQKTTQEYFMGDRNLKTVPVALSILVSFVSAILVLGTPAEMYTRGTALTMRVLGYCIACVISSVFFVPLMYPLRITSCFEYLQRRYDSHLVKLLGSFMMLIGNVFYMGLLMYTPCTALEAVTPFPFWSTAIVTGFVSTLYTALGGLRAVVYTDTFQAAVMIVGMLAIVIQGTISVGGIGKVLEISQEGNRLIFFNFNPDPRQRLSFWSLVIGGAFSTLTIFGIGQSSVQRYSSLPSIKQAKRSVYLNIPGLIVVNILASLVGLVIYAYYASVGCDPIKQQYISNANQLVPYFVIDVLNYPGVPGIFLAVLFSGALSSMSSSLNGAAAVTWEDVFRPLFDHWPNRKKMIVNKALVIFYGLCSICVAFLADGLGGHVLQASLSFTGATMGPSLGMFLLGALSRKANAIGAVCGCLTALAFNLWLSIGTFIHKPYRRTTLPTSIENCLNPTADHNISHVILQNMSLIDANKEYMLHSNAYNQDLQQNVTTESFADDSNELTGLSKIYEVSFLWYACFGCLISMAVGLLVSLATDKWYRRKCNASPVPPELLIPVKQRLWECLPKQFRKRFKNDNLNTSDTRCGKQEAELFNEQERLNDYKKTNSDVSEDVEARCAEKQRLKESETPT